MRENAMPAELHRLGDERFEELARPATNRYPTSQPQAIARCATPTDVAHVINFACGAHSRCIPVA